MSYGEPVFPQPKPNGVMQHKPVVGHEKAVPCCDDWEPQMAKVNGPILLQAARDGKSLYDGKPFAFCPWCGTRRSVAVKSQPDNEAEEEPRLWDADTKRWAE